ncbi:histidine utilization repressor [Sphingomonas sp.]|jgi:GntR family histidine utilization transcriptional repressor|uniref:histidine utilization repressor n=1 Tax=Sphingomonas sp. TaxID=28214 RepID=UPI002DE26C83|nr:histidine utilization repressor [Sphingomonas sp.]HEV2568193.1 histidine utilization repressor [Sphingomonas sp.]
MDQPAYARVKAHILDRIGTGAWAPQDRVPSENALVREFGVARMTVNRAVRELAQEGYLTRVKGGGTYVADRRSHGHPLRIRNIADEIAERGHRHSADVLDLGETAADEDAANAFDLTAGAPLFRSMIVHFENDEPVQLEERLVNPSVAPDYLSQDFGARPPYEYLMAVAPLAEAEHVVQAVMPPARVRQLLGMSAAEPCLLIRRRTWTGSQVASTANLYHPGSRYELSGRFTPQETNP